MADKKDKHKKNGLLEEQKIPEAGSKRPNISDAFLDQLKWAFTKFEAISAPDRIKDYGDKKYLEQFRLYFKANYPNLLDQIDKKDLPVYLQAIEKKWFTLGTIRENTWVLSDEFAPEGVEIEVMTNSLEKLKEFCGTPENKIPTSVWEDFAKFAWFDQRSCEINPHGKLQTMDDLRICRRQYTETKEIAVPIETTEKKPWTPIEYKPERLKDYHMDTIESILNPQYNPTERVMVGIAIDKIRKELPNRLRSSFDRIFPVKVTAHHKDFQDLKQFSSKRRDFLHDHAHEIDPSLTKKLDDIIVTNGDIYKELSRSWRKFDDTRWFSAWEQYFRRIFNKLASRQLFDEFKKTKDTLDHYVEAMGNTFKRFPPYVDEILVIHPFNAREVGVVDPALDADLQDLNDKILDVDNQIATSKDPAERTRLRQQAKSLKQEKELRKRHAYIDYLNSKDTALWSIFSQLVETNFNFSNLLPEQQQYLLDVLVKHMLQDTITNKVPELLDVDKDMLTRFINDLFDLQKMELTIPTKDGSVHLKFTSKTFMGSKRTQLPAITDLAEDLKNLPLNFTVQLNQDNAPFFEDSQIFTSLYTDFNAKNGIFRINDAYKVRIKKDGRPPVEWYLSSYPPPLDKEDLGKDFNGKECYLYSSPVTTPDDARSLVTRPQTEEEIKSKKPAIPVVILDKDQRSCDMELLDRKLNLTGDAFWALLFGYVLGQQSMNTSMSQEKERELAQKMGSLDVYKEKEETEEPTESVEETVKKSIETTEQKKFFDERQKLKWYGFPEDAQHHGFVPWTMLYMPFSGSSVPPESVGNAWLQMEITHVNTDKGTFTVKVRWWELRLWKTEWSTKELPMTVASLTNIKKAFGDIYKVPSLKWKSFAQQFDIVHQHVAKDLDKYFWSVKTDGSRFTYSMWNYIGKEVTHFGTYEQMPIGESVNEESGKMILYKIHPNANGTITVSWDPSNNNYAKHFPARDMDYVSFMLFVKEKWLQPKCKDQVDDISKKVAATKEETPTTVHGFSINNIVSFFKNGVSKIKDSIKKYDDERTEELTDTLTSKWLLRTKLWWFLSPFSRISESFENMGMEYYMERDNRIWKKVEKRAKFYEDYDYTDLYTKYIWPMLNWQLIIKPHYKIAAMLLVHLKKGKWPYAKYLPVAQGQWIGLLLGKDHQERYLAIREKRIRDLEENAHIYGNPWADQIKNELVELEMRYIVHVMDGRHMGMGDDVKYYFQNKYSKKFCDELEWAYKWFYNQSTVEEWFTKNQDVNFEFARVEYFRLLADRPQQALPFLKIMATKAISDTQRQVFDAAVLTGILSWVFLNMTYSSTQKFIQNICRTRGFIPWLFTRDIRQQSKIQALLDLYSWDKFTKDTKYDPSTLSFRTNIWPKGLITALIDSNKPGNGRFEQSGRMKMISDFFALKGKGENGKTLLDLLDDHSLPTSNQLLLKEYIEKSNEKHEWLDPQVQENTSSLTWSILTKSQSVVEQMIKIDQDGFAGKDGDAKYNMEEFSKEMKDAIPSESLSSEAKVNFFLKKFLNRFPVFSWTKKADLIKRLLRCKNNSRDPEIENIMYYSITWEIIQSVARPPAYVPVELDGALNARKDFFLKNLDVILRPAVIDSTFGGQYVSDMTRYEPKLIPWDEAAIALDKEEQSLLMYGLTEDEKRSIKDLKNSLKDQNCINASLYNLAYDLSKKCSVPNRFKHEIKKTPSSKLTPPNTAWARIKNYPDVIEQVKQILSWKNPNISTDDYIPEVPYDD